MAVSMGQMDSFDENNQDWPTYFERLQQYFIFQEIKEEKQVAALLSLIGDKTYSLVRDLVAPEKPAQKSLEFLNDLLQKHLSPKPLLIAERFRFHKREQMSSESVSEYFAVLKKLSRNCDFNNHLNDALRDRFVCAWQKSPGFRDPRYGTDPSDSCTKRIRVSVAGYLAGYPFRGIRHGIFD